MMGRQLRRAGHNVTVAEDGVEAISILEQETFDVVVSDLKMPRADGMAVLARANEISPETEFVILTGHGTMENAVDAFKTGRVFDYLLKPLEDIRELDGVVARAAERRQLRTLNARLIEEQQRQIVELEEARTQLAHLADCDGLTGLLNHRAIHKCLEDFLTQNSSSLLALAMLDMDGFKLINDTYGHPTGDDMLRYLTSVLQASCANNMVLGRCGGDEFLIVAPDTSAAQLQEVAQEVHGRLDERPFCAPDGSRLPVRVCIGIVDTQSVGHSMSSLVAAADSALYEAKAHGGDEVTLRLDTDESLGSVPSQFSVLDSLITTIDRKDHYTKHHSEHVTYFALILAQAMGLSNETCNAMRIAGLLHDVGKIGVPDYILRKPGKLTSEEYEVMKGHVTLSALIIHGLPRLNDIHDAVANHHERWDGAGYPSGLAGEQIPVLGRVMAIADAFSAMTLDRPYRKGLSVDEAIEEIARHSGSQFDPNLAQVFLEQIRSHRQQQAA